MIDTKLILIEGMPGAGKTTSTMHLGKYLQNQGVPCRWYLEGDDPHPINCLQFKLKDMAQKLPPLWTAFVEQVLQENMVAIVESRLWQNTALFMFMSEFPIDEILRVHQLVWRELAPLSPVLIYHDQDDVESALKRLYQLRGSDLVDKDMQAPRHYAWFCSRDVHGLGGWVQFFEAWQPVAEKLYSDWPFEKIRIRNSHNDWARAYQQIHGFLQVEES